VSIIMVICASAKIEASGYSPILACLGKELILMEG
jgi:hypothetical protein